MPRAPSSAARATDCTISSRPISSIVRPFVGALQAIELVEDGAQRERHVVARVPVGDGKHVEVVDLLAARFQMRERPRHGDAKAQEIGIGHDDTSITFARRPSWTSPLSKLEEMALREPS